MEPQILHILEIIIFFLTFPFVFMAFNAFDLSKFFKKAMIWQIQIIYIFSAIIFTYLFTKAIINLIYLSGSLLS
ncbi:MAG: DUF1146 family protein [Candidatus Izimaplasma sp.]|nr:DUF1146 family protein [Candidatus Izimaplasma bacterium]